MDQYLADERLVPLLIFIAIATIIASMLSYDPVRKALLRSWRSRPRWDYDEIESIGARATTPVLLSEEPEAHYEAETANTYMNADRPSSEANQRFDVGVWHGVKFGFGFAIGVFAFGFILFFFGSAIFAAAINATFKSAPSAMMIPLIK